MPQLPPLPVLPLQLALPVCCGSGVQSLAVQQLLVGMQVFVELQMRLPPGQAQAPGGPPLHTSPLTGHSAAEQQAESEMHELLVAQVCWPAGQEQLPPMPLQCWPASGQSVSAQQVPFLMQILAESQTCWLAGQVHAPALQMPPAMPEQSASLQQLPLGMQLLLAGHTFWLAGQVQVWPGPGQP